MDQLTIEVRQPGELEPDALAIPFPQEDSGSLSNGTRALDERLKGRLQRLVEDGELKGRPPVRPCCSTPTGSSTRGG